MERVRMRTLMLLVVIAALCLALVVQRERARREADRRRLESYYQRLLGQTVTAVNGQSKR